MNGGISDTGRLRTLTVPRDALLVPALATIFYALGQFELLDYMGGLVKKLVEVALFLVLLVGGFDLLAKRAGSAFRQPLVYLGVLFFVVELVFIGDPVAALGYAVATYSIILVFIVPAPVVDRVTKLLVALCGIFSLLGLIQAVILVNDPDLIQYTVQFVLQPDKEGIGDYHITHPIALLGMTPGQVRSFLGVEVPRMQSFLREPGLLLSYFLLPGALALMYPDKTRFWALPIIFFSFLGFTGTVYVSLIVAVLLFIALSLPIIKRCGTAVGVLLLVASAVVALSPDRFALMGNIAKTVFRNETFLANIEQLEFLDRYESAVGRLDDAARLESRAETEIVYSGRLPAYVGLIGYARLRAGVVGVAVVLLVLGSIFVSAMRLSRLGARARFAGALVAGITLEATVLQQYGFEAASGFLILALTLRRMQLLVPAHGDTNARPNVRALHSVTSHA